MEYLTLTKYNEDVGMNVQKLYELRPADRQMGEEIKRTISRREAMLQESVAKSIVETV